MLRAVQKLPIFKLFPTALPFTRACLNTRQEEHIPKLDGCGSSLDAVSAL